MGTRRLFTMMIVSSLLSFNFSFLFVSLFPPPINRRLIFASQGHKREITSSLKWPSKVEDEEQMLGSNGLAIGRPAVRVQGAVTETKGKEMKTKANNLFLETKKNEEEEKFISMAASVHLSLCSLVREEKRQDGQKELSSCPFVLKIKKSRAGLLYITSRTVFFSNSTKFYSFNE